MENLKNDLLDGINKSVQNKQKIIEFVKKYTMLIVLVIVFGFFTLKTNGMLLQPANITSLILQNAYVFVLATGMLLCILTGGNIDLSVGSVVCFVGAVGAQMLTKFDMSIGATVLIMLAVGTLIGAFQAFWIAYVRIPPFIVTLAGMLIFRGLSNVVLNGQTVSLNKEETFLKIFGGGAECYIPDFFNNPDINLTCLIAGILAMVIFIVLQLKSRVTRISKGYEVEKTAVFFSRLCAIAAVILAFSIELALDRGIPTPLIWVMLVIVIYAYITSNTKTGRYFYAVGGNEKSTQLSGINTNKVYFLAYTNMGFLAAFAALLTIARQSTSTPQAGQNYEMDAIASCFIGGASAYGGIGTVPGVIIGAVLMGVINIGMSLMSVDQNYQKVVKGAVLLVAVIFDVVSKRSGKLIVNQ